VQRGDVLERHQDVPVQLDVGDVLDRTVGGQDTLLVLPAEERHLDLLALVLVRVVVHGSERSQTRIDKRFVFAVVALFAVPVCPRCAPETEPNSVSAEALVLGAACCGDNGPDEQGRREQVPPQERTELAGVPVPKTYDALGREHEALIGLWCRCH
jgi:hypothetical protein